MTASKTRKPKWHELIFFSNGCMLMDPSKKTNDMLTRQYVLRGKNMENYLRIWPGVDQFGLTVKFTAGCLGELHERSAPFVSFYELGTKDRCVYLKDLFEGHHGVVVQGIEPIYDKIKTGLVFRLEREKMLEEFKKQAKT